MNVHRNFICNRQKDWKQPKDPATGEWISTLWGKHKMEYYSTITREELLISNNMDESQNNCAEWKRADEKVYTVWSHLFKILKYENCSGRKQWVGWRGRDYRDAQGDFWEVLTILIEIDVWVYTCQTLSDCVFKIVAVYCMLIKPNETVQ